MQNLKRMQREEARQQQELTARAEQLREQQEKRFNQEKMVNLSENPKGICRTSNDRTRPRLR